MCLCVGHYIPQENREKIKHTEVQRNMCNLKQFILCFSMLPSAGQNQKSQHTHNLLNMEEVLSAKNPL